MKTAERTSNLKRILSDWYRRDDYSTDHAIDDIYDQFESSHPSDVSDKWIRFEDKLPLDWQEIMLVWPSGNYHPEYRKVTKDMLKGNCSLLRWIPIPKY